MIIIIMPEWIVRCNHLFRHMALNLDLRLSNVPAQNGLGLMFHHLIREEIYDRRADRKNRMSATDVTAHC